MLKFGSRYGINISWHSVVSNIRNSFNFNEPLKFVKMLDCRLKLSNSSANSRSNFVPWQSDLSSGFIARLISTRNYRVIKSHITFDVLKARTKNVCVRYNRIECHLSERSNIVSASRTQSFSQNGEGVANFG